MKIYIHASTDYDSVAVEQASKRCAQIRDIIVGTVTLSAEGNRSATGEQNFDNVSKGYDANIADAAYNVLSSMYDLSQEHFAGQVSSKDILCLVFAEITPGGEVLTNDVGLLSFYPTLAEYTAKYANSQNIIKTMYCNLPLAAICSGTYNFLDSIVPGSIDELIDIFSSLGYYCEAGYKGDGIEIAKSLKDFHNRKHIELTFSPIRAKKYSNCILIPSDYFDAVNKTINIPQSFIDKICDLVDNHLKGWQPEVYWDSIDPESEEMDKAWEKYLKKPEAKVNKKLKVFPEPSTQGSFGYVYIHDESGNRDWDDDDEPIVDYMDWLENELYMASRSSTPAQYAEEYENYLKSLIGE